MTLPPVDYLEAFEKRRYQTASENETLKRAWKQERDPVARAFLLLARAYLDAEHGDIPGATARFQEVAEVLEGAEDTWQANTLAQHAEQCVEYLGMGKPLPELPGGL